MRFRTVVWFWIFIFLVVGLVFWYRGMIFLDPDFGWHLRMGEYIIEQGVPKTDQFSYTMPSFPHVDHEWLADALVYPSYNLIGGVGLALVDALLVLGVLLVSIPFNIFGKQSGEKRIAGQFGYLSILLMGVSTLLYFSRVRYLVVSWLFLAVLVKLIFNSKLWLRWRFLVPVMFLVWANLHGGFVVGLMTMVFVFGLRFVRAKKVEVGELMVLILSVFVTLVNPYGVGLWREVWSSVTDNSLRWSVQEWQPIFFVIHYSFPFYLGLSSVFLLKYKDSFSWEEKGLYMIFLAAGFASQRHLPLWVVVSMPLTYRAFGLFLKEVGKIEHGFSRLKALMIPLLVFSISLFVFQVRNAFDNAYAMSESVFYPEQAAVYLADNIPEGEIFSRYGWGGYLLWKLPEKGVFLDGRMPSWRWKAPNSQESDSAFDESNVMLAGEVDFEEVFEKYNVDTVVWPISVAGVPRSVFGRIELVVSKAFQVDGEENILFEERLLDAGWKEVYRDSTAAIYKSSS